MSDIDLIRAWKDEDYRLSMDLHEQAMLPQNPAGEIEVWAEDVEYLPSTLDMTLSAGCPPHLPI